MLNDKMLKPNNETCLQCKDQLKQITISREKMLQVTKSIFFEKWDWSFETLNSSIFFDKKCEPFGVKKSMRSFWDKCKLLNKIICFDFLRN